MERVGMEEIVLRLWKYILAKGQSKTCRTPLPRKEDNDITAYMAGES
jgi:hypothetical protein